MLNGIPRMPRWIYYSVNRQALEELNQAMGIFFDPERIKPRRLTCGPQGEFIRMDLEKA